MRRALPYLLLLVALLASAGGGVAGAALSRHERAQEIADAKARAERARLAADARYRDGLGRLIRDVADVTRAAALADAVDVRARIDVGRTVRLQPVAQRVRTALDALAVPPDLATEAAPLTVALDEILGGARQVHEAADDAYAGKGQPGLVDAGFDLIRSGGVDWDAAVAQLLGPNATLPAGAIALQGSARFIIGIDDTCSRGEAALDRVDLKGQAAFKANGDRFADLAAATIRRLRTQLGAAQYAALRTALTRTLAFADGIHDELRGIRNRSYAQAHAGYVTVKASLAAFHSAETGFAHLGSTWCEGFFGDGSKKTTTGASA